MDNNITYSSSLEIVNPQTLFTDGYELSNQTVVQSQDYIGSFSPDENIIEFYIYDANKTIVYSDYNFSNYRINENYNPSQSVNKRTQQLQIQTSQINLTPEDDIASQGFTNGDLYAVYNFINLELGSSPNIPYYLAEISSDRTEIRLKSNFISTRTMKQTAVSLKLRISNADFFDEVYISFGNNEYHIGVNVKYDDSIEQSTTPLSATNVKSGNAVGQSSILIKLYDPLPAKYDLLDELYVTTKTAESQGYLVKFINDYLTSFDNIVSIKGPNSNLKLNEFVNNNSINQNKDKLLGTKSSGSKDQLLNRLAQTGVQLSPDYSTGSFKEFINFSSAKEQVSNFVEKVSRIHAYEADIDTLSFTTSSNPGSIPISESIASLYTKIENEITAFSGFDYYQYYSTSSDAYPKTGTGFPLELLATSSVTAQSWITGAKEVGDNFDNDNQNWLYYTVPDFIKNNTSNNNYLDYLNMVGQSFDEVWLYTKAITEKLNTTNNLDKGIPLQLADDVITSLGYTGFGNNYNNQDNFIGLIGNDDGLFVPPTGSELINHYIAINGPGGIINYWDDGYSWEDYVESFRSTGFPYPIDKVSKEIFKRLYHNMAYLVKKKGTVSGLRQLINIWGIPNTILRINEFGGKNKDEENDYDLWYQRYSYAFSPVPAGTNYASASVRIPWQPLLRNYIHSHNEFKKGVFQGSEIAAVGIISGVNNGASDAYGVDTQFTVTGGGSGGKLFITAAGGQVTKVTLADAYAVSITTGVITAGSPISIALAVPAQNLSKGTVVTSTTANTIIPEGTKVVTQAGMTTITLDQDVTFGSAATNLTFQTDNSSGYSTNSVITITGDQINALNDPILGTSATGTATFPLTNSNLGAEQIVPDGIGFRFKTTGYPSSSFAGNFDSQSLFIKKSTNAATDADFGIALYYTGSASGSGAGNIGPTYSGSNSSAYRDYGEMRFFIKGDPGDGGTAMSDPIYLPFFDKGWWSVQLQRDKHPIVTKNDENTTYTLYVGNKIYDGADGNQIGFTGSVSINSNQGGILSQSINESWNSFSLDLAQYGAGAYLGGWGSTLASGTTGSIGTTSTQGAKGIQRAGKNFSGSLQEFRYYSHDISESVFNDFVMNPESIEGNHITGSESSFDIVNFRAPLGNELENKFTSSKYLTKYIEQIESVHPAITGSSPLTITGSFYNPFISNPISSPSIITSSYDVCYEVNTANRTYSDTNVETYFLDQPSIGIRNRVSNKIKYSTNLNFGNTLSPKVSIQQDPPISQSYTDNINSLEVAFSPTEEINDDIIQTLGYGAIQEIIADPRFRSSSDDYYPGLRNISDDYFKKFQNRSQVDYLRLIKYFDDSLFRAIKNYVPARTSVSTGIVIKQHMLERNRYREPQVDIVTTQSYAPFNQPLTTKNLELTGSANTHQLWDPIKQTTFYSSSFVYDIEGGPGGSVNQYNILEEGGSLFVLESDDLALDIKGVVVFPYPSILYPGTGYTPGTQTLTTTGGSGDGTLTLSVTANSKGELTSINSTPAPGENYIAGDVITVVEGANTTATATINKVTLGSSLFEAVPLEEVNQDITLVDAGPTQAQGTATFSFSTNNSQTTSPGASDSDLQDHSITIITVNPSDGSLITKNYVTSDTNDTGNLDGTTNQFIRFQTAAPPSSTTAAQNAQRFVEAINSVNGQGSGAAIPTIRASIDPSNTIQVILTQLYGGTDGNTTITYGSKVDSTIGSVQVTAVNTAGQDYTAGQVQSNSPTTNAGSQIGIGSGLGVNAQTTNITPAPPNTNGMSVCSVGSDFGRDYKVGDTFSVNNLSTGPGGITTVALGRVTFIETLLNSYPAAFTGGTSRFSNTFLNVDKSLRTPIYVEYDFKTDPSILPGGNVAVTIEASSSIRGVVYSNTTTYINQEPAGSILRDTAGEKQYFTIHPEEDMHLLISSNPAITIDDYQVILGENILITTALAAQSTTASPTLLLDTFSNGEIPSVGSVVTGRDIKAGVVTVLGAVTAAGTGYTPGTSVLATTGAGGGNLTLDVTVDANGNVTTASLVGGNPGTGYTSGNIVTIVGGNNDAKVEITTATSLTIIVSAFDPTTNQVTFNENQTITDNSKITFTETAIPDVDTEPVSQQGSWNYNITTLGIDNVWDDTQEQFYDGAYSGSNFSAGQYYNSQYNPYRKVKPNSTSVSPKEITVNTGAATPIVTPGITLTGLGQFITFDTTAGSTVDQYYFLGITSLDIIPYQVYNVEYDVTIGGAGVGPGAGQKIGMFLQNYDPVTNTLLTPQIVSKTTNFVAGTGYSMNGNVATTATTGTGLTVDILEVDSAGTITSFIIDNPGNGDYVLGETVTITGGDGNATFDVARNSSIHTNGVPESALTDEASKNIKFSFRFLPNLDGDTALSARYTLGFQVDGGIAGSVGNIVVTGEGGIYENVKAPIFFSQQDAGYIGQRDYQNMDIEDAQGNIIGGVPIQIEMLDPAGTGYSVLGGINQSTQAITGVGTGLELNFTTDGVGTVQTITIGTTTYSQPTPAKDYSVGDIVEIGNISAPIKARVKITQINSEIYLVENTQSVLYDNSDYNPLSNNVNTNRSSSYRYVLSYGTTQSVPDNFDLVVTQSYFPLSVSGTFPERADVPDSNYTAISSISPRYTGTKLKSLTYNFFTPSGSVGPEIELPIMPVNRDKNPVGFRVATEFLDGSVTSSFSQSLLGQGSTDWEGDSKQYSGSSTIDKHPIYMARFDNSYEQLNFYNTYQFNIDQLIEVPREPIAGTEITPNSIIIDGSNENKKVVSSVFEPKRQAQINYLNPKTLAIDYSTMTVGNFDILAGSTEFLTLNTNAKNRVSASLEYRYTLGGTPPTGSRIQNPVTVQMVTGSNTRNNPENEGILTGIPTIALSPQINRTSGALFTLAKVPLTTIGGPGKGAVCTVTFSSIGIITQVTITNGGRGYLAGSTLQCTAKQMTDLLRNAGSNPATAIQSTEKGVPITATGPLTVTIDSGNIVASSGTVTSNGFLLSGSLTTDVNSGLLNGVNILNTGSSTADSANLYQASPVGTYGPLVTTTNGQGSGATVNVVVESGAVNIANFSGAGSTYTPANATGVEKTTTALTGGGSGLTVIVDIVGGAIQGAGTGNAFIKVGRPGTGYSNGDSVSIDGGDGFGRIQVGQALNGLNGNPFAVTQINVVAQGERYKVGDQISVEQQILANAGFTETNGDLTSNVLSTTDLNAIDLPYFVNFIPSPVSSSQALSFTNPPTIPQNQQLLVGGPQLAVHHAYNSVVSSSLFEINPPQQNITPDVGPQTLLWTTSGSNPSNIENYMIFDPDGSDASAYQNSQTPFLIERGDIIRVEGVLNTITDTNISQSTNVIEDFTVEEIQDYFYTSSYANAFQGNGALTGTVTTLSSANVIQEGNGIGQAAIAGTINTVISNTTLAFNSAGTLTNASVGDVISCLSFGNGGRIASIAGLPTFLNSDTNATVTSTAVSCELFQVFSATIDSTTGVTSNSINGSGGTLELIGAGASSPGWSSIIFSGGDGYQVGDEITINTTALADASNWTGVGPLSAPTTGIIIRLLENTLDQKEENPFTIGVDVNAPNTIQESGSIVGYNLYPEGGVGFTAPTFIRVSPDPQTTLNGLNNGEITKFTIRRQIEADDKVMLNNVNPPSGSRGVQTQSGQGFLIPNDFSEVQKANALNIINQLRAKNAFNKPIEPGITDGGRNIIVQGSGSDTIINIP